MQNTFKLRNKCVILVNSSLITVFKFKTNKKSEFVHVFIQFLCVLFWCVCLQKTVVAVLDQMMNPHWPHLPTRKEIYNNKEEEDAIEGVWRTITDDPVDYHFYYHVLDGDEAGRPPKHMVLEDQQIINGFFNLRDKSCLHVIAKCNNKVKSGISIKLFNKHAVDIR